jgi:hypothetical protein
VKVLEKTDTLVELYGPVDVANDAAVETPDSVLANVYNDAKESQVGGPVTTLTADALAAAGTIFVAVTDHLQQGFTIGILQELTGLVHVSAITAIPNPGEITLTTPLVNAARAGDPVSLRIVDIGSTVIPIEDPQRFEVGDSVEVLQDDATVHSTTVNAIGELTLTLAGALTVAASAGNRVSNPITTGIALSAYGSFPASDPVPEDPAWGYRGKIAFDLAGLELGQTIRAEITLLKANLNIQKTVWAKIGKV